MTVRLLPRLAAALLLLPALGACTVAPATGREFFTGGLTPAREAKLGAEQHEKVLEEFGGTYRDPALAAYVSRLGALVARTSETPDQKFTFTVLNSPIVNAFALPGGYVYVTRGLLALADSEAEMAGVLAHEIGHVTARHAAERYGQAMAAKLAGQGLRLLLGGGRGTQAFDTVSTVVLRGWSRDQEYEADLLGVRYLSRAGFDPRAMAGFLARLQAHGRLEAERQGRPGAADEFSFLQTHPRTADRIARAIRQAGAKSVANPVVARDLYLKKVDGMLYGDDPKQGLIRGRRFLHPMLRFAFDVPEGFRLLNGRAQVAAKGPQGAVIIFDTARADRGKTMVDYLTRDWAADAGLETVEAITIDGLAAATGQSRVRAGGTARDFRLVAIRGEGERVYRFLFATPPEQTGALSEGLKRTTYSFRRLSPAEAAQLKPYSLRLYRVRPGDTAARIAGRMPFESHRLARFLVLNGLRENSVLRPGQIVKTVTY